MANEEVNGMDDIRFSLTVIFKDGTTTVIKPLSAQQVSNAFSTLNFEQRAFKVQPMESYRFYLINPSEVKYLAMAPL